MAIATPLGEAGISVVRLSGAGSVEVVDKLFQSPGGKKRLVDQKSHTLHYGHIVYDGEKLDEVMVSLMRAPRSYTVEDVVEISCHGGTLTTRNVMEAVLRSGARLAGPGEFTRRAFVNGRIDLAQAEAVMDLIHARSTKAREMAQEQLEGRLSREIDRVRDDLMNILAHVEAHIDFPDEDISPDTHENLCGRMQAAIDFMSRLLDSAHDGKLLRRGIRTAIIGKPNAGKSSLLNILLGEERAIVSDVAGTTRDTIEEFATIRGIPIVFIDTAGLRESGDAIELEGMRRSRESSKRADLVLHIMDLSVENHEAGEPFIDGNDQDNVIHVGNKKDIARKGKQFPVKDILEVSCRTGEGMDELKDAIESRFWRGTIDSSSDQVMINARHEVLLGKSCEAVIKAVESLRGDWSLEIVSMELRIAVEAIGEIVGKTSTEDLLDKIFSQFCLGK